MQITNPQSSILNFSSNSIMGENISPIGGLFGIFQTLVNQNLVNSDASNKQANINISGNSNDIIANSALLKFTGEISEQAKIRATENTDNLYLDNSHNNHLEFFDFASVVFAYNLSVINNLHNDETGNGELANIASNISNIKNAGANLEGASAGNNLIANNIGISAKEVAVENAANMKIDALKTDDAKFSLNSQISQEELSHVASHQDMAISNSKYSKAKELPYGEYWNENVKTNTKASKESNILSNSGNNSLDYRKISNNQNSTDNGKNFVETPLFKKEFAPQEAYQQKASYKILQNGSNQPLEIFKDGLQIQQNFLNNMIDARGATKMETIERIEKIEQATQIKRQILVSIDKNFSNKDVEFNLQLTPKNLGKIHINIKVENQTPAKIVISSENKETLEHIKSDVKNLFTTVEKAGFKLSDESISFNNIFNFDKEKGQQNNPQHQAFKQAKSLKIQAKTRDALDNLNNEVAMQLNNLAYGNKFTNNIGLDISV